MIMQISVYVVKLERICNKMKVISGAKRSLSQLRVTGAMQCVISGRIPLGNEIDILPVLSLLTF